MLRCTVDERSGSSASLRQCAALPMLGRKVYLMRSESPFAIAGIGPTTRCWHMQGKSGGKQRRRRGDATMSLFTWRGKLLACSILATAAAPIAQAVAEEKAAPPDFSSNNVGWVGLNGGGPFYEPVPGRVPPVSQDPAHPFVPNGAGKQPTFRIADLTNPNLTPWAKGRMKKDNDEVLAGKVAFTPGSSCMPAGVPG